MLEGQQHRGKDPAKITPFVGTKLKSAVYSALDKEIKASKGISCSKDNISFNSQFSTDNSTKIKPNNASGTSSGASNLKGTETTKDYTKSHIDAKNPLSAGDADIKYGDKDSQIFARKIQSDGIYYAADEFKINKEYYNKLWKQGRPTPFLQARQILDNEHKISVDIRGKKGFLKYEGSGLEMIYNPTTKEIWHIMPSKKKR